MKRDMKKWKETRRLAMDLIQEGGRSAGEIREALKAEGVTDLPVWQTIQKWADYSLSERKRWDEGIISFAKDQLYAGATPEEVQLRIHAEFGKKPDFATIREWAMQKHNPWKVAHILFQCRFGASSRKSLQSVRRRLVKYGAEHLARRITLTEGMEAWEIGQYLEECGENQAAIDTALLGYYTQQSFKTFANLCLKKKKIKKEATLADMPAFFEELGWAA